MSSTNGQGISTITLQFVLEDDLPGNRLAESPPSYWQLHVEAEVTGVDYNAYFFIPIYRPL